MGKSTFKISNFPANAFVIVESNQRAEHFFIIRSGKVQVTSKTSIPGEDSSLILGQGDFFGVVAAMSGHPHIETAKAITECSLILIQSNQFGQLIQKNAPIAMKIIRYFSRQLRVIDHAISRLAFHSPSNDDPEQTFEIGEYYYEKKEFEQAVYAYQTYLALNPQGQNVAQSKARLQALHAPLQKPALEGQSLTRQFKQNSTIMIEHEPGTELYIIQTGKVKISKIINQNEVLLATLKSGDIFGEMAILENKPRSASATAIETVTALVINKKNFESMVVAQTQLAVRLITILSDRIWLEFRRLANNLITDPMDRIYDMLLTLVLKKNITITKNSYVFDVSTDELMKMLGYRKENAKSYMATLRNDKNLNLNGSKIVCNSLEELEKIVMYNRKRTEIEKKRAASSRL